MNWFEGSISDAISQSQAKKLVFLVYAHDSNCGETTELWSDEQVWKRCLANCVSIKLDSESETCNQFKQIYPIACFPTTYLIGNVGGTPIRIITGNVEKEEFISRLDNAFEIHQGQQNLGNVPNLAVVADKSEETKKKELDDKVAQAKEKLKQIQAQKRLVDEENDRKSELDRRRLGQEVVQAKKDKEDTDMKRIAADKRKEKLADEMAKKRVMDRIKEDREEKQKKYAVEKTEIDKVKEEERLKRELNRQQEIMVNEANKGKVARIQFRLTDGSTVVNKFEPEQKLEDARSFITQKLSELNESTSFTMHSTFPKRDYTTQDMPSTLRDLQLVPTATLLIIPVRSQASKTLGNLLPSTSTAQGTHTNTTSTMSTYAYDFLGLIMLPFTIIWGIVTSLFGFGHVGSNTQNTQSSGNVGNASGSSGQNSDLRMRRSGGGGNVRGVHDANDKDDEKTTYNGNSTQQL